MTLFQQCLNSRSIFDRNRYGERKRRVSTDVYGLFYLEHVCTAHSWTSCTLCKEFRVFVVPSLTKPEQLCRSQWQTFDEIKSSNPFLSYVKMSKVEKQNVAHRDERSFTRLWKVSYSWTCKDCWPTCYTPEPSHVNFRRRKTIFLAWLRGFLAARRSTGSRKRKSLMFLVSTGRDANRKLCRGIGTGSSGTSDLPLPQASWFFHETRSYGFPLLDINDGRKRVLKSRNFSCQLIFKLNIYQPDLFFKLYESVNEERVFSLWYRSRLNFGISWEIGFLCN